MQRIIWYAINLLHETKNKIQLIKETKLKPSNGVHVSSTEAPIAGKQYPVIHKKNCETCHATVIVPVQRTIHSQRVEKTTL